MNKRENLLWQIVLIVGLLAILYNGYKLYNMNNNVIKLWENFEKEEIGTDKKLTDMVERLEISLEERLNSTFEIEPDKNPSNLETVYKFGDRERIGNKHFNIKSCGKHHKNGPYCIISLRNTTDTPRIYVNDKIAGGVIKEVNYRENRVLFEKDGITFEIRKEQ